MATSDHHAQLRRSSAPGSLVVTMPPWRRRETPSSNPNRNEISGRQFTAAFVPGYGPAPGCFFGVCSKRIARPGSLRILETFGDVIFGRCNTCLKCAESMLLGLRERYRLDTFAWSLSENQDQTVSPPQRPRSSIQHSKVNSIT